MQHLIDRKGYYFHGNRQKPDAWHPEREEGAEALATLAMHKACAIGDEVAMPTFNESLGQLHFEMAAIGGFIVSLVVTFKYRVEDDELVRAQQFRIGTPGTEPNAKMAALSAGQFLPWFEATFPTGTLRSADCVEENSGATVWSFSVDDAIFNKNR